MITLQIDLTDKATPELRQLLADVKPGGGLGMVMGRALADTLKKHFRTRNATPNALGGKRTNFWSAVAAAVQNPVVADGEVRVAVSHPHIAQKVRGGRINPKKTKVLAIPVNAKAHGVSPRTFTDLAFIPARGGPQVNVGYLVEGELHKILRGPRKGTEVVKPKPGGAMMYVLRGWVDQLPDPKALPDTAAMLDPVAKAARSFLSRPQQG